jgi:hypothetical protein
MTQDLTKHTTAQVVAALSRHHDWTAEAPHSHEWIEMGARFTCDRVSFNCKEPGSYILRSSGAVIRHDWTIRRADGLIVERKPRRKRVVVGKVKYSSAPMVHNWWIEKQGFDNLDKSKTYKLVAVET